MSPAVPPSVPRHLAVIMDGNGRWAERRRRPRVIGHRAGLHVLDGVGGFLKKERWLACGV